MTCGHSRGTSCVRVPYPERVRGDGDGWVLSDNGAAYWGKHGAAGLLLRAPGPGGSPAVLLQHRAPWSHQGGTWGLPGGARDSHESPEQAAVREAQEESRRLGVPNVYEINGVTHYELPNGEGVKHAGCGDHGGCSNPTGCGWR